MMTKLSSLLRTFLFAATATLVLGVSASAFAACSSPSGTAGELNYNFSQGVMQYCNGSHWVNTGPSIGDANLGTSIPTSGLIGHWNFEDGIGTTATDIVSGNDATLANMDNADWVTGKVGTYALDFDGSDDFLFIPDIIPDGQTGISFGFWGKADSWTAPFDTVMAQVKNTGTDGIFSIGYSPPELGGSVRNASNSFASPRYTVPASGSWFHVMVTYDGSLVRTYHNGILQNQGSLTGSLFNSNNVITIGAKWENGIYPSGNRAHNFDGQIDDVRIYNRALTATEVFSLYRVTGDVSSGIPTAGLVGHWPLDDGTGSTATDIVGGNNGTLTNMDAASDWVSGVSGSALDFDGSDDYVSISHDDQFRFATSGTLSVWINPQDNTGPSRNDVISFGKGSIEGWSLYAQTGNFVYADGIGGDDFLCNIGTFDAANAGNWFLFTVTFDRSTDTITCYKNGSFVTSGIVPEFISLTTTLDVGGIGNTNSALQFEGMLDDLRVYNRALTANEVENLYEWTLPYITAADCSGLGDAHYNDTNTGRCYYRVDFLTDWDTAKAACEVENAYLTVISSASENTLIQNNIHDGSNSIWIGATDAVQEGRWEWIVNEGGGTYFWQGTSSGTSQNGLYENWNGSSPNNNGGNEHHASMQANGEWTDAITNRGYTCEKPPVNSGTTGLSTCVAPNGIEGEIVYNDDLNVMQYCSGAGWVEMR